MIRAILLAGTAFLMMIAITSATGLSAAAHSPSPDATAAREISPQPTQAAPTQGNGDTRSSGAQVLPLPAPDPSTARGQERGNAALRENQAPSASGSTIDTESQAPHSDK